MKVAKRQDRNNTLEIYQLIVDKLYRMNLLKELIRPDELFDQNTKPSLSDVHEQIDNNLSQAILPAIIKTLDKGLFEMYQILYTIDVEEEEIKDKILNLENPSLIPSVIAFAIIDRLKARYQHYPLINNSNT